MALTKVTGEMAHAATESTSGVVELATAAEINTGTDTVRAVSPGRLNTAIGFSSVFTSSDQTMSSAGTATIAHGLGRAPINIALLLVCQTGEAGYTAGDVVLWHGAPEAGVNNGLSMKIDATNLTIRYGTSFYLTNATTGASTSLTFANWKLRIRAWA